MLFMTQYKILDSPTYPIKDVILQDTVLNKNIHQIVPEQNTHSIIFWLIFCMW